MLRINSRTLIKQNRVSCNKINFLYLNVIRNSYDKVKKEK